MVDTSRTELRVLLILLLMLARLAGGEDWPQWRGPNRDGVWSETGILEAFPPGGLKVRWRAPVGVGFSSPVVAQGSVYLTDSELVRPKARERVHSFEALTGTLLWTVSYEVNYKEVSRFTLIEPTYAFSGRKCA